MPVALDGFKRGYLDLVAETDGGRLPRQLDIAGEPFLRVANSGNSMVGTLLLMTSPPAHTLRHQLWFCPNIS
jgi:hypothetical protein